MKCPNNCEGWRTGWEQIVSAQVFCANQAAGPRYTSPVFRFCPWCGSPLESLEDSSPGIDAELKATHSRHVGVRSGR